MNGTRLAQQLLGALDAPKGAVSVFAVPDPTFGFILKVWVRHGFPLRNVPTEFDGYPVRLEKQPSLTAGLAAA
jgi:hypothetical protein